MSSKFSSITLCITEVLSSLYQDEAPALPPLSRPGVPRCLCRPAAALLHGHGRVGLSQPIRCLWNTLSATFTHIYWVWRYPTPSPTSSPVLSLTLIWMIFAQPSNHILRAGNCCRRLTPLFPEHCSPVGTAACSVCVCSATRLARGCVSEPQHHANTRGSLQPSASVHSFSHFCLSAGQAVNYTSRTDAPHPLHGPLPCLYLHGAPSCHHFGVSLATPDGSGLIGHRPIPFPRLGVKLSATEPNELE